MPFLHWFKSKPDKTVAKAEPVLVQKPATEQAANPETERANLGQESEPGTLANEQGFAKFQPTDKLEPAPPEDSVRLQEPESAVPSTAAVPSDDSVEAGGENEIKLPLKSILSVFPPELEPPSMQSLSGTEAEIALPLDLIQSQLANGRVVAPAEIFCRALPSHLKPYFEAIDPAAEIPIPLQEIFPRLPTRSIKLREDQEIDHPEETIPTPFSAHAEEDAKRFGQGSAEPIPFANEMPKPKDQPPKVAVENDSQRLQAIFMTDEPLDLAKTIEKVAELPGLRSCILSTSEGLKLAGSFSDASQEAAIAAFLPELFEQTRLKLETLHAGSLETITLCYGLHQLSTFVQRDLCLTVFHDHRPFKPGVREKVQAVMTALTALSTSEKPL
jgi:hypothetical protein